MSEPTSEVYDYGEGDGYPWPVEWLRRRSPVILRTVIESKPGASIKVERVELTAVGKAMLTCKGKSQ